MKWYFVVLFTISFESVSQKGRVWNWIESIQQVAINSLRGSNFEAQQRI